MAWYWHLYILLIRKRSGSASLIASIKLSVSSFSSYTALPSTLFFFFVVFFTAFSLFLNSHWNSHCSLVSWLIIFTWYIVSKSVPTSCDSWYWWAYTDWSNYINWKLKQEFEFFCYVTFYFLQVIEDLVDHMVCSVYILIYFLKLCNKGLQRGCNPLSKTRQIKWSSLRQAAYKPCVWRQFSCLTTMSHRLHVQKVWGNLHTNFCCK